MFTGCVLSRRSLRTQERRSKGADVNEDDAVWDYADTEMRQIWLKQLLLRERDEE